MVVSYDQATGRKMVNQYLLLRDIGRGCHGRVKQALDVTTGKVYAIKIIDKWQGARRLSTRWSQQQSSVPGESLPQQQVPPAMARLQSSHGSTGSSLRQHVGITSPVLHAIPPPRRLSTRHSNGQLDKIRKEIAILKKCRHPNVVHLYEVVDDPSARKIYLVLDYLEGGEIRWRDEDDRPLLSLEEIRSIFRDLVLGVEYLHYQGIIHRDIKPANLLRDSHGVVKISDFGVSHFYQQGPPSRTHLSRPESTYSARSYVPSLPSYTSIASSSSFQPLSQGRPIRTTRHRSLYSPSLLSSHSRDSSFQYQRDRPSLHDLGRPVDSAQALGRRERISRPLSVTSEYYPPHPVRSDALARQNSDSPLGNRESHVTPSPHRFPSKGSLRPTSLITQRSLPSTHSRMVTAGSSHFHPHPPATYVPDGLNSDLAQARTLWSTPRAKSPTTTRLSPSVLAHHDSSPTSKSKRTKTPILTFSSDDEDEVKGNLPDPSGPLVGGISAPPPKAPVHHPSGRGLPPPSLLSEAPPPGEMESANSEEPMVMPTVNVPMGPTDAVYDNLVDSDSDDFWSDFDENEAVVEDYGLAVTPTYVSEPVVSNPPSTSPGLFLLGVDGGNTTPAKTPTSKPPHSPTVVKWAGVSQANVHPFSEVSSELQGSPVDQSAEQKLLNDPYSVRQHNPGSPSGIQWPTVLPPLPDSDILPSVTEESGQGVPSLTTNHTSPSHQRAHQTTPGTVHRTSHATLNEDKELAKTAGSPAFFAPELCCTTQELTSLLRKWAETRSLVNPPTLGDRHASDPSGVPTSTNRPLPSRLRRPSLSNLILNRLRRPLVSRSSSNPVPPPPEQSSTPVPPYEPHFKTHSVAKSSTVENLQSETTDSTRKYSLGSTAFPQKVTVQRQFSLNRNLLHPDITLSASQQPIHRSDKDPLCNKSDPITETSFVQPTYAPPITQPSTTAEQSTHPSATQSRKPRPRSLHVNVDGAKSPTGDQAFGSVGWKWWQALSPSTKAQVTTLNDQGSPSNSVRSAHHVLQPGSFDKRHQGRSRSRSCLPEFRPMTDALTLAEDIQQRNSLDLQRGSSSTSAYPPQVEESSPTSQLAPPAVRKSHTDTGDVTSSLMPGPVATGPSLPQPTQAFLDYPNLPTPSYYGITKAIDIWAMGVTLYCLVYGRCPFVADTEYELFQIIPRQPLTFPDDIRTIPDSLRDLLSRLLDKDYRTRITIEEVKRHPWVTEGLQTEVTPAHQSPKLFNELSFPKGQVNGQDINHAISPTYQWPKRIGQGLRRLSVSIAKGLKGWRVKSKDHTLAHR
ncbi:hypothetical protein IWQ62_001702 [Dispira parvispora]|uniref:Protein kinase domain-containing protein n=1 Tax=Dispira parvispora TaxID=1520584 RepID=A0A9W8AYD6_9FUNG|nr:hypothetical protein IWQ62_001702 [Dispira parvispora]